MALYIHQCVELEGFQGKLGPSRLKNLVELEERLEASAQWVKQLREQYERKLKQPKLTLVKPEPEVT